MIINLYIQSCNLSVYAGISPKWLGTEVDSSLQKKMSLY